MRPRSLLPGFVATVVALALLWAASRVAPELAFPPSSLGDAIVRVTPGDLATTAIDRLQHNALKLLDLAAALALVGYGTALALVTRGRPRLPYLGGIAFAASIAALAALDPVPRPALANALAAAAAGTLYGLTLARVESWRRPGVLAARVDSSKAVSRRRLLELALGAGGALAAGSLLGRIIDWALGPRTDVNVLASRQIEHVGRRAPFPSIAGLSKEITSVADHYVVDIDISDPVVDAGDWRLSVGGLVDEPLKLSFDELQERFELVSEYSVLTCISNKVGGPLVGNSRWTGVRLRDVLAKAGVGSSAVDVAFRCVDGYSVGIPLARARHPSVLLAIAQDGQPLTREHGFPCRVRVPALYGMMNAKWLKSIEVVDHRFEGYWQNQGWSDVGTVRTESRIDTTRNATRGKPTWIAGVAWAGDRGVSAVEVSVDGGGTWRRAKLHQPISPLAWTQWASPWTPSRPGRYTIACRATDGTGRRQDVTRRPPHPSGASGYHELEIDVT